MSKHVFLLFILALVFFVCPIVAKIAPPLAIRTVVIDAGHGGKDPGCLGSKYKEKDVALAVALKLGKYIQDNIKDVKVIYTRETDVFVEVQERPEIANRNKADLFISVHCNSACVRDKKLKRDVCRDDVHGAETYVMGIKNEKGKVDVAKRENASILLEDDYLKKYDGFDPNSDEAYIIFSMYQNAYLDQSLNLSAKIQKQYKEKAGRSDKGVKRASLWVLWKTAMPSLLTEIGFITNPEEEKFLGSEKGQDYIASGIFRAFREYKNEVEGRTVKYDDEIEKQDPYKPSKDTTDVRDEKEKTVQDKSNELKQETKKEELKTIEKDTINDIKTNKSKDLITDSIEKNSKETSKTITTTPQKEQSKSNPKRPEIDSNKEKNNTSEKRNTEQKEISSIYKSKIEKLKKDSVKAILTPDSNSKTIYKVQIASGNNKVPLSSEKFKGVDKIEEYYSGSIFKYTAGEFETEKEAIKLQNDLRKKGFPDAFVVAFRNGERVPLNK